MLHLAPASPWKTQSRMEKLSAPELLAVLPPGKGEGQLCRTRPVRRRLTVQQLLAMTRHPLPSGRGITSLHRRCAGCPVAPQHGHGAWTFKSGHGHCPNTFTAWLKTGLLLRQLLTCWHSA